MNTTREKIAIDIGNTRCKIGQGEMVLPVEYGEKWLARIPCPPWPCQWWVGSVNRPRYFQWREWMRQNRPDDEVRVLNFRNIPIEIAVASPEKVGTDRLLAAVAANTLRQPGRGALIVDLGTALKVDWLDENGIFRGGAIAPGLRMGALALHLQTDALPEIDVRPILAGMQGHEISPVGQNTFTAIQAGLFWGMVGTIRELVHQMERFCVTTPQRFLTGGGAESVLSVLGGEFQYVEEMVMMGIHTSAK
ncbi:MAG: type III pantothenate kinase [Planctomycetia bacterium]|nr:type III pantothenate kinase [Planctomycetia bacterium]